MRYRKIEAIALLMILTFAAASVRAQEFKNLTFDQLCPDSPTGFCNWDLSWGKKAGMRQDRIGTGTALALTGEVKGAVVFVEQSADITSLKEPAILTLSGTIATDAVDGKGAGLNINLYDTDGKLIMFKDMGALYSLDWASGTRAAKRYSISLVCPAGTARIRIRAILFGKGTARFGDLSATMSPITGRRPSKLATRYITEAARMIKKNSLVRDSFDQARMTQTALSIAGDAKTYADCYLAVSYLLESLREYGDFHSFFMKAAEVENWKTSGSAISGIEYPTHKVIDGVGYINVPSFHGGNQKTILAYADVLQSAIRDLQTAGVKGWVIDLRANTGGNMEPMIAGLGPLFSAEKLGSLIDVNKKSDGWYYKNGRYYGDDNKGWSVTAPVTLAKQLPIAVLISGTVGSSGEIVVISFIGNAKTKLFGQPTMGLTTGNGSFDLSDGARIFIASTVMADRTGKPYTGSIKPDVEIEKSIVDGKDVVLNKAIEWILLPQQ